MGRIVIVTADDGVFIPQYLGLILPHKQVVGIVFLPAVGSVGKTLKRAWRVFGWGIVGQMVAYAWSKLNKHDYGVPVVHIRRINFAVSVIRQLNPDVLFSLAAPQKFGPEILRVAKYGCFNIHSSLLPKYRGVLAPYWALKYGEHETGFTIHKMDEQLDTGPMWVQKKVKIERGDTFSSLTGRIMKQASPVIRDFFDEIIAKRGRVKLRAITGRGSYYA